MTLPVERVLIGAYDLFEKQAIADQAERGFQEYYYPKSDIQNGNIEFVIEGNSEQMILPSLIDLKLTLQLEGNEDGKFNTTTSKTDPGKTVAAKEANVAPVNNYFHSIFDSVHVSLSSQPITNTDHNYAYISYLQMLCNYGEEPLQTNFALTGWEKDTAGEMDTVGTTNNGFKVRQQHFYAYDNKVELIGKLFSPIFMQEKALPTQVSMRVTLEKKSNPSFYLMHEKGTFDLKIVEAVLRVQKVVPTPMMKDSYLKMLNDKVPIPYHLIVPSINPITIEQGSSQFIRDNLFLGKVPQRIIIALVETDAYLGARDKNPFNFQHFNVREICLYKDGMPFPRPMARLDFKNGKVAESYHNFMLALKGSYSRFVPNVTIDEFKQGFTLFVYDMSPDQLGSVNHESLLNRYSNVRLEMKFAEKTPTSITLLAYSERDHLLEIFEDRRVNIDL